MSSGSVSASLSKPPKEDIYETTAENVEYSCTASLPSTEVVNGLLVEYVGLQYSWEFSDGDTSTSQSGTCTFDGLTKGAKNVIKATVTVKCTANEFIWVVEEEDRPVLDEEGNQMVNADGEPVTEKVTLWEGWEFYDSREYTIGSASAEQTIYTHPGTSTVYSGLAFDQTIQENLTSGLVAKWVEHCGKWRSWWFQSDQYESANGCNVNSNDVITAGWFNSCTAMAVASSPSVSGGPTGTIISADLFKQQDELISRRE